MSDVQVSETPALTTHKRNVFFRIIAFPFKLMFGVARWFVVVFGIVFIIAFPLGLLVIAFDVLTGLIDLIFRSQIRQNTHDWFQNHVEAIVVPPAVQFWTQITAWSEQVGLTALLLHISDISSEIATEIFRGLVLFVIFVTAGCAVYHLRIVRRPLYACVELIVALVAMWIAIDGMAGGDFSAKYIIALLSGLYIMVRGLQNADEGLREMMKAENETSGGDRVAHAWFEVWQAFFYGHYSVDGLPARFDQIKRVAPTIITALKDARAKKRRAISEG